MLHPAAHTPQASKIADGLPVAMAMLPRAYSHQTLADVRRTSSMLGATWTLPDGGTPRDVSQSFEKVCRWRALRLRGLALLLW